jgi:hypothetical protein
MNVPLVYTYTNNSSVAYERESKSKGEYSTNSTLVPILKASLPRLLNQRSQFHLLILRLQYILSLHNIRVCLFHYSHHFHTFSSFSRVFRFTFSRKKKSWLRVQVSTPISARELEVTDSFFISLCFLFFF